MKKGKITMMITIGIACFCLMLVMFMQFKVVNQTDITSIENMREAELREELANWKSKYEEANTSYEDTKNKIEEYKKTKQSNEETETIMDSELEQINLTLGTTDVEGEGIEVLIKEPSDDLLKKDIPNDLLEIVNSLKLSGAEAISINGKRVVNTTDIVLIGNEFTKVNGERILAPYIIKAIGDPSYLEGGLIGNGGKVDKMRKLGEEVTITKQNKVEIGKYTGTIKTKYIEE